MFTKNKISNIIIMIVYDLKNTFKYIEIKQKVNMNNVFKSCPGLKNGTMFPELVSCYEPGQSMKVIKYLRDTNQIGEGCNG